MPSIRDVAELERAAAVLRAADNKRSSRGYIPHKPHARQAEFLSLTTREALFGGAAGGGKSDALLMAALQYVHVPGYSAILFRRTYQDLNLPGAIMARSHEWLQGSGAKWNGTDKRWTFPSGAMLSFGYLDNDRDRFRYASAEFQFIGFDELTTFPENWYRFLFSRLRRTGDINVPLRMRAATNPGGLGHEWVRRRFIETPDARRPFVPSKLVDNPSIDAEEYLESLAQLDAATRLQLEEGVWTRDAEGLVYQYNEARNTVRVAPEVHHKGLALDFGVTDPTSFSVLGWRDDDPTLYVLRSFKVSKLAPSDAAERINKLEHEHQPLWVVGDLGGMGKAFSAEFARRYGRAIEPAEKSEKLANIALFNGDLEKGRIKVVASECESLTTEWQELPWHESRQRESGGFDNHCADGVLYGWRKSTAFIGQPKVRPTHDQRFAQQERDLIERLEAEGRAEDAMMTDWLRW